MNKIFKFAFICFTLGSFLFIPKVFAERACYSCIDPYVDPSDADGFFHGYVDYDTYPYGYSVPNSNAFVNCPYYRRNPNWYYCRKNYRYGCCNTYCQSCGRWYCY